MARPPGIVDLAALRRLAAVVALLPLVAVALPPPGAVPRAMTLPEALEYARLHQPAVQAALARIKAAEADARATRAQWVPYVGATAQLVGGTSNNTTASIFSSTGVDLPRIGGTPVTATGSLDPYASTLAAVGITQEGFDVVQVARVVLVAYDEALQRAVIDRDQARAGVKAGLRAPIDLTRSEAD